MILTNEIYKTIQNSDEIFILIISKKLIFCSKTNKKIKKNIKK